MKEERPCTKQLFTLGVNHPLLETSLLQINQATACITMCDCPHPSTTLPCLQFWLHLTAFVTFTLGLALNSSHSGKSNGCFMDASSCLYSRTKRWHTQSWGCYSTSNALPFLIFHVPSKMAESSLKTVKKYEKNPILIK